MTTESTDIADAAPPKSDDETAKPISARTRYRQRRAASSRQTSSSTVETRRAAAEARRAKALARAEANSGTQDLSSSSKQENSVDDVLDLTPTDVPAEAKVVDRKADKLEADSTPTAEDPVAEKKPVDRMAQYRARRFNSSKKMTAASKKPDLSDNVKEKENKEEAPNADTDEKEESDNPLKTSEPISDDAKSRTVSNDVREPTGDSSQKKVDEIVSSSEGPKKYQGVAAIRRRKIVERRKLEEKQDATSGMSQKSSSSVGKEAQSSAPNFSDILQKKIKKKALRAAFAELLVLIVLFGSGIWIGFDAVQNSHVEMNWDALPPRMKKVEKEDPNLIDFASPVIDGEEFTSTSTDLTEEEEDEFSVFDGDDTHVRPKGATASLEANIDPVFGIDLDALTADPTIVNFLGRRAIAVHRFFIKIVLFFIGITKSIIFRPLLFLARPPMVATTCLIVRFGAKVLLRDVGVSGDAAEAVHDICGHGGCRPRKKEGSGGSNNSGGGSILDQSLLGIASSFVPSPLRKFWRIFSEVRADIVVVLAGVFVGLGFGPFVLDHALELKKNDMCWFARIGVIGGNLGKKIILGYSGIVGSDDEL